jgi:SAM-dependent methyltransferase
MTDFLRFTMERLTPYAVAAPLLARALGRQRETRVLDLCSGGGGPWRDLVRRIPVVGGPAVQVTLTDAYPNQVAFAALQRETDGVLQGYAEPVRPTAVPEHLAGLRTMFTALHHFRPSDARAILADAVRRRTGIAVFEITRRSLLSVAGMLVLPLFVLLATPFIRPFRWSRLLVTYLVPLVPLAAWFDATVSCLRSYTRDELLALARDSGSESIDWEAGVIRSGPFITHVTYLIGVPRRDA